MAKSVLLSSRGDNPKPFLQLLADVATSYVRAYNGSMEVVNFQPLNYSQIGASGQCPHCAVVSYFRPVATYAEQAAGSYYIVSAVQCEQCKRYGIVIGRRQQSHPAPLILVDFYPISKPDDRVDKDVPRPIAEDFAEALRCNWINAYKACVVMCRRAVQASALALGAPKKKKLIQQIDVLFEMGRITEPLKDFAHEVRLTGDKGAHPDKNVGEQGEQQPPSEDDGLEDINEKDASDIIEFTREYLHHVYVMPAKLAARRKPAQVANNSPTVPT